MPRWTCVCVTRVAATHGDEAQINCARAHTHTYTHMNVHTHTHTHIYTFYTHTHTHTHTCAAHEPGSSSLHPSQLPVGNSRSGRISSQGQWEVQQAAGDKEGGTLEVAVLTITGLQVRGVLVVIHV